MASFGTITLGHKRRRPPHCQRGAAVEHRKFVSLVLLVDRVLEAFAGLEFWLLRSGDLNLLASTWVEPLSGAAIGDAERPKADEANFSTACEGLGDRIENAIDGSGRVRLGQVGLAGNVRYEVILVHDKTPRG